MRNILYTTLFTIILFTPFTNLKAEIFQLEKKVNKRVDGIIGKSLIYKAPKQLNVNYTYVYNTVYEKPVLFINYNEKQTNISDLLTIGSVVNNLDADVLKKTIMKKMPKVSLNDEYSYEGSATVSLKDIEVWRSDTDVHSTVILIDIIKYSSPKKISYETY